MAIPITRYFTGFSTQGAEVTGVRILYDIDLCKQDLLNHFNTRFGERVMRPDFGCHIWEWLMEPLTDSMVDMIAAEATRVVEYDTRCTIVDVQVTQVESGVTVQITASFAPWNVVDTFTATFDANQLAESSPS